MDFLFNELIYKVPESDLPDYLKKPISTDIKLVIFVLKKEDSTDNIELLKKICTASGFDYSTEVALVALTEKTPVSISQVLKSFKHIPALFFGIEEEIMITQFHRLKYTWINFNENKMLFSDSITVLNNDQKLKKQLWIALKQAFKL